MLKFPMMYDDQNLPEAYRTDLNQIFDSGRQLLHVINDILDLARVDAGKLEIHMGAAKITPLIEASTTLTKGLIGTKPIQIKKHIPEDLPLVWADESRLRQVLLNVLSNAAKYTDEGFIEVTIEHIGDEIQFKVQDTGIGIHEKYQSTLFEEFQQAENITGRDPRAGAGLGLAITRQLVTLMDGKIGFESEIGKGSTFYFTLNVYDEQDKALPKVTDVTPLADHVPQTQPKRPEGLREAVEAEKQKQKSMEVTN
jgi:signal transduction histidine kinase